MYHCQVRRQWLVICITLRCTKFIDSHCFKKCVRYSSTMAQNPLYKTYTVGLYDINFWFTLRLVSHCRNRKLQPLRSRRFTERNLYSKLKFIQSNYLHKLATRKSLSHIIEVILLLCRQFFCSVFTTIHEHKAGAMKYSGWFNCLHLYNHYVDYSDAERPVSLSYAVVCRSQNVKLLSN